MTIHARQIFGGCALAGLLAAGMATLVVVSTAAQSSAATKTFANEQYRYTVALPAGCRHEEGPGTVDAVCSADLDPDRSAVASTATALVLEVGAEIVADDAGKTASELALRYGEAAFRDDLPETICGVADKGRVRIDNVQQVLEDNRVVYTADVICSEVKFLQIGERRASVRFLIAPDARYRLVARAPTEDFEKQKDSIAAFFASFRVLPIGK